ncbi:hypothetical protein MMC14_005387 [Varicellaria rhodocarpa]|nr:hypothetical protein [Varicellaria rhodocarpa]
MASTRSLPIIDISPFLIDNATPFALERCATTLSEACLNHGFFYLTNHSVPASLTKQILDLAHTFFSECSDEEKLKIRRQDVGRGHGDGARGYQVIGDNVTQGRRDLHEAIDWYRPIVNGEGVSGTDLWEFNRSAAHEQSSIKAKSDPGFRHRLPPYPLLHGINYWPSYPTTFRSVYEHYITQMLDLGTAVVRAMGHTLALPDPETFVKATRNSFWVMRAIGYPPLPPLTSTPSSPSPSDSRPSSASTDAGISCGAHTDYGCLTLLLADSTPGALQVQSRSDPSEWINADPIEGAFVVNIGDMMERWTGGKWKSTMHRVVHRGDKMRVSVPFFFEPDWDARVRCLVGGGGEGEKVNGGEVVYGEHLIGKVSGNFYGGEEGGEG